jgi:hypothetical protein
MKTKALFGVVLVLGLSMTAAAWDVLAHSFIMEQIKGGPAKTNGNEVYGVTSPDFVNYLMGSPYFNWLYDETHKDFMRVWHKAETPAEQSLAMGFVAHNGLWGADYTAHVAALTLADKTKGYIIQKAEYIEALFGEIWAQLGIDGEAYAPLRLELCHNIIEYVIDLQVWLSDPTIADRVVAAAAGRDASMQRLVKTAYAGLFVAYSRKIGEPLSHSAALSTLQGYENAFQQRVVLYASLFASADTLDEAIANLSYYLAALANEMFGLEIDPTQVGQILGAVLYYGVTSDVATELGATVNYVHDQLIAHQVVY